MSTTITRLDHLHRKFDVALAKMMFIYGPSFELRGGRSSPDYLMNRAKRRLASAALASLDELAWIVLAIQFRSTGFLDRQLPFGEGQNRFSRPSSIRQVPEFGLQTSGA